MRAVTRSARAVPAQLGILLVAARITPREESTTPAVETATATSSSTATAATLATVVPIRIVRVVVRTLSGIIVVVLRIIGVVAIGVAGCVLCVVLDVVGLVVGSVLATLERFAPARLKPFIPAPSGLGIAMTIPGYNAIAMFTGALIADQLQRHRPAVADRTVVPVSSGLIAGASLMGIAVILTGVLLK